MNRSSISLSRDETRNIEGLADTGTPAAFCDVVRVETPAATFLYVSGQTPVDDDGNLVGGTMEEQTRQVLRRIARILEHEGATMADIVRVRVFVTDIGPDALRQVHAARNEVFAPESRPASTLVQISGIIRAGGMIEIDADAVLPGR